MGAGPDLVLVHGWGMNGAVWEACSQQLQKHFTVHIVDLPGYGFSHSVAVDSLSMMSDALLEGAPQSAIWLGWSLGGVIATYIAMQHPERVNTLITLASSPKFSQGAGWKGIKPRVLNDFRTQLSDNFALTIERFMALQAMGSATARQDTKRLKKAVLSRPSPNPEALELGLEWLAQVDLRSDLLKVSMPFHRWYGRLDGLVPLTISSQLAEEHPQSEGYVFAQSSHAPFITEANLFVEKIIALRDS
ncbi:pimeloyl-ACP methyl ester esterase BioH [Vibrio sp. ZSDZ34]|uniref:Pimeloyl-[acyl-carrier protein] methyl ester esterase n=1 Tax=Vibrio gelatinilyticus TaxID=2893468 RepID=A0A9X1WIL1_9VIBR|nr:pimeloyl-ACP methyl ester esterase BioH [Vibrio gelatinilyticus]MCJ2378870.1 pimeloyl-ACP methyl ester esterase BioH [Vibrio gelatinilyticus]